MRRKEVALLLFIYLLCIALAGLLWHRQVLLSLCYVGLSIAMLTKWHARRDLFYFFTGFILGPAGEFVAVYLGAWKYSKPLFLLPLWLPLLWGIAALFMMRLAETLAKE